MATKPSRSDFILKLHDLLEHPLDAENLRWTGDLTFEITSHDRTARHALSGKWEFNSLSSFIRQLSYYNFKRLSDRRRSNDRRMSQSGYIIFSHPSGFFRRGDSSELGKIVRKSRNRPEKAGNRRVSTSSMVSNGSYEEDTPPMPSWPSANNTYAQYGYPDDRRSSQQYALGVHHQPTYHMAPAARGGVHDDDGSWRTSFSSVKWQEQTEPNRQENRRSVDYRVTLPSPRRLEHHNGGRNHAALSIQTNSMSNESKAAAYPTPSFHSPSYGQIPLPDSAAPSGLPSAYVEPSYSYSQHPVRETSLPSPSDSDDHGASGIDSPPWITSKLAPIHHHESRMPTSGVHHLQRKASLVSPRQSFFSNLPSQSAANWNYPLPSPTEPKAYDYSHSAETQRRPEYFENNSTSSAQRDQYRS